MAKIGDNVRFLNDVGGGTVVRIEGRTAYVRDPLDGFETPVLLTECIVIPAPAEPEPHPASPAPSRPGPDVSLSPSRPFVCRPATLALIFEPHDIKRLSQTAFDLYLVNDSPFRLHYVVAARDSDCSEFTLLAAGEAEPDMQAFIREVPQVDLNSLAVISVQALLFTPAAPYSPLPPVNVETRMDLTRLARLHCFTPTAYSSAPVLTLPILTNNKPAR